MNTVEFTPPPLGQRQINPWKGVRLVGLICCINTNELQWEEISVLCSGTPCASWRMGGSTEPPACQSRRDLCSSTPDIKQSCCCLDTSQQLNERFNLCHEMSTSNLYYSLVWYGPPVRYTCGDIYLSDTGGQMCSSFEGTGGERTSHESAADGLLQSALLSDHRTALCSHSSSHLLAPQHPYPEG